VSYAEENGIDAGDYDHFTMNNNIHVTADGSVIKIASMTDEHLFNCWKKFRLNKFSREMNRRARLRLNNNLRG
jgi:hypothetical protein